MMMRLLGVIFALFLVFQVSAMALEPGEMLKNPALEARARALSAELRCLVCQNQSIDESEAPLAKDLRVLIRERLTAGDSDDEIMNFVVSRYGEFVLLKPRFSAETALLWLGPFLIVAAAVGILLVRRRRPADAAAERALTPEEKAVLDRQPPTA